jgi:CheY-like chemotaxis protein
VIDYRKDEEQGMAKPKRILIVEDEAILALDAQMILKNHGYKVKWAKSGSEAIECATSGIAPDLILMDIDLGDSIDGIQAASSILMTREIPIVLLTSNSEKEMVDRVKRITRYGYVLKNSGEFVLNESITMAMELFAANQKAKASEESFRSLLDLLFVVSSRVQASTISVSCNKPLASSEYRDSHDIVLSGRVNPLHYSPSAIPELR